MMVCRAVVEVTARLDPERRDLRLRQVLRDEAGPTAAHRMNNSAWKRAREEAAQR